MGLLARLFLISLVPACVGRGQAEPATVATVNPTTPEACRSVCKGDWGRHGLADDESCNCRTRDAGKRCRDGHECEGDCLLDETAVEVTHPGPPRKGYFLGKCAEMVTTFGCARRAADGALRDGPTELDSPPPEICAD